MAWKNGYYYRNSRQGDKVMSEYVGTGPLADIIAQEDAAERLRNRAKRELLKRQAAEQDAIDAAVDTAGVALYALVDAALLVNGYRQRKRQWRKQRDKTDRSGNTEGSEGSAGTGSGS
ncbi:MAG: hypothetical protein E6Q97_30660 [Desulfurellales bacterium]|nr:MAG: hypothetical protein E6Q97_30660 [Desulfurellales bacterium]